MVQRNKILYPVFWLNFLRIARCNCKLHVSGVWLAKVTSPSLLQFIAGYSEIRQGLNK